jgi:hypothetical protein
MGRHAGERHSNQRLMTALFSDGYHVLHLVEIRAKVKWDDIDANPVVDLQEAEKSARTHAVALGHDPSKWDLVGILVAADAVLTKGRIMWAQDVRRIETVSYEREQSDEAV